MSTPTPPQPGSSPRPLDERRAWAALRTEMAVLHARLEYLRLMLRLGVRSTR